MGRRSAPDGRGRLITVATSLLLAALCWAALILWFRSSTAMPGSTTVGAAGLFTVMWLLMMSAMMLPGISPFVLLFRTIQRRRAASSRRDQASTAVFVSGYLAVWLGAGLAAFVLYPAVQAVGNRIHAGAHPAPYIGGGIVVVAGIYQFTPLKNTCLVACRSPLTFVLEHWRDGRLGALRMGLSHGLFCLGCCWGIMAVLLVVGLMDLAWMAALSVLIIVERLAPRGVAVGRAVGVLFVALGLLMASRPDLLPATGLTMSASMRGQGMQMARMPSSAQPAGQTRTYRAIAGPYTLTLVLGPAETMLTAAEARARHARHSEIVLGRAMSSTMVMGATSRHLELHVTDAMGMAITNAHVTMRVLGTGAPAKALDVTRMYGIDQGVRDLHYGANVDLAPGRYTVRLSVNGHPAVLTVQS